MTLHRKTRAGRTPLSKVTSSYDRIAPLYARLEWLYLIFPLARRKAVRALGVTEGDTVLEIGAGSGRNLPYLIDAVGPRGRIVAVDASSGMLAEARKLVARRGWGNVELICQDAARLDLDTAFDAVLFSLSYSVLPEPRPTLAAAWARLRPGRRLVVMDMGLTQDRWHRLLTPIGRLLVKLAPGDPFSEPWSDLAAYGDVETERFLLGLYYVCTLIKPQLSGTLDLEASGATPDPSRDREPSLAKNTSGPRGERAGTRCTGRRRVCMRLNVAEQKYRQLDERQLKPLCADRHKVAVPNSTSFRACRHAIRSDARASSQ